MGRARVLRNINEARNIESGDILVLHSVDIGWSPYFPLLSGLITELGGLMSHGECLFIPYRFFFGLKHCLPSMHFLKILFDEAETLGTFL